MKKPLGPISKKAAVHTIHKIIEKNPWRCPPPIKTADIVPVAPLEMDPTMGIPQVYIK